MTNPTHDPRWLLFTALAVSCGADPAPVVTNDYPLSGTPVYPERVGMSDRVRTIVVSHEVRAGSDRRQQQCTVTALLFDTASASTTVPAQSDPDSNCRFYATRFEDDYTRQRWICAGALGVTSQGVNEQLGFCPADPMRAPSFRFTLRACGSILGNGSAHLASMDEGIPGDVLTDLNSDVTLPGGVIIQSPSTLATVTWPETGDLTILWTGASATSATVRLEPTDPAATSLIVCNARRNGVQRIPADMLAQAMYRTQDVKVTVTAFREQTVMAEGGRTYRLAGASSSNLILQGRR